MMRGAAPSQQLLRSSPVSPAPAVTAPAEPRASPRAPLQQSDSQPPASPAAASQPAVVEYEAVLPFGRDWGLADIAAIKKKEGVIEILNNLVGGKAKGYRNLGRAKLNQLVIDTRKAKHNHTMAAPVSSDDDEDGEASENGDGAALTGDSFRFGGDDRVRLLSVIFLECMRPFMLDMETQGTRAQLDENTVGGARISFFVEGAKKFNSEERFGFLVADENDVLKNKGYDPDSSVDLGHNTLSASKFKVVYTQLRKAYTETHRKWDQSGNGRPFSDFCNTQQFAGEVLYLHRLLQANGALNGFFAIEVPGGFNGQISSQGDGAGSRKRGRDSEESEDSAWNDPNSDDSNHGHNPVWRGGGDAPGWLRDALGPSSFSAASSSVVDTAEEARITAETSAVRQRTNIDKDKYLSDQLAQAFEKLAALDASPKNDPLRNFLTARIAV